MLMVLLSGDFFDGLDLGRLYTAHPYAFDSVLYLILFLGIARVTLGRRYHGRGGRAVVGSGGTMLAIAAVISARKSGFALTSLAPIAWIILALVLVLILLDLLGHTGSPKPRETATQSATDSRTHHTCHTYDTRHTHHQHTHDSSPDDENPLHTNPIAEDESAMAKLLAAFIEYLQSHPHGINQHASTFLIQIARTHRRADRHYKQLLTALARSGWRADPDKKLLAADVESVIQAMFRNNALFIEAMRIAEAAIHGENVTLLLEAIIRMQQLEQEAIEFAKRLIELIERLVSKEQNVRSAEHTAFIPGEHRGN